MESEVKKIGPGRPRKQPTALINFRAPVVIIDAAKANHGRTINKRFNAWLKKLAAIK